MPRIPDTEIERLKSEISLQRLAESQGIQITRHGADLIGLCPFHDDREPLSQEKPLALPGCLSDRRQRHRLDHQNPRRQLPPRRRTIARRHAGFFFSRCQAGEAIHRTAIARAGNARRRRSSAAESSHRLLPRDFETKPGSTGLSPGARLGSSRA